MFIFFFFTGIPFITLEIFLNELATIYVKKRPENRFMTVLYLSLIRHVGIYTQNIIAYRRLMKI